MTNSENRGQLAQLFAALFDECGKPRQQWLSMIEKEVFAEVRAAVPDIVDLVFVEISNRCLERVAASGLPADMTPYGWISSRLAWDSGRVAQALARAYIHAPTEYEDGTPIREMVDDGELPTGDGERLLKAVRRLLPRLSDAERAAFEARLDAGFDAARTYEALRLPPGQRGAHNTAFSAACQRLASLLISEGWVW